jgi:hypothetical protein
MATLLALVIPLVCAGLAATIYGAAFTVLALRQRAEAEVQSSHAFSLSTAFMFALTLSIILVACAALRDQFGENGVIFARTRAICTIVAIVDSTAPATADASTSFAFAARASPIPIQPLSPLLRLLHPESSLRLTLSCPFWPGFRPTPSARSCLPLPAADFRLLFA